MGRGVLSACAVLALVASEPVSAEMPADPTGDPQLDVIDGRPVVDGVYVNGHGPYRFLIDTGSTFNHLDASLAESLGLTPTLRTTLVSSTGSASVQGCEGMEIRVGSAQG